MDFEQQTVATLTDAVVAVEQTLQVGDQIASLAHMGIVRQCFLDL
jgi:hypothetical protein